MAFGGIVGCDENPIRVDRLEITNPGLYENYLVDGQWAGGNRVKIAADGLQMCPPQKPRKPARGFWLSLTIGQRSKNRHQTTSPPSPDHSESK